MYCFVKDINRKTNTDKESLSLGIYFYICYLPSPVLLPSRFLRKRATSLPEGGFYRLALPHAKWGAGDVGPYKMTAPTTVGTGVLDCPLHPYLFLSPPGETGSNNKGKGSAFRGKILRSLRSLRITAIGARLSGGRMISSPTVVCCFIPCRGLPL